MALVLPHVHVDRRKRLITEARAGLLSKQDRSTLLNLDWELARSDSAVGDRLVPLDDDRWAVGRGSAGGTLYRLVDLADLAVLHTPAWLWVDDTWFDPDRTAGPEPEVVPLKRTFRHAARLVQSTRKTANLLAAVVAHLRRPDRRPLAIVVEPLHLTGPANGPRWFALALLSCLPPQIALTLRVGCLEPRPDPRQWDIVLTASAPQGFDVMEAARPPGDLGSDLVAWLLRRRLLQGEPELAEALATHWDESADDPWAAGVEHSLAQEGPAALPLDRATMHEDFPIAHRITLARVRGGARITNRLANEIAAVTAKSGDPELWRPLATYSEKERARVFAAWLAIADRYPADDALLEAIGAVRPALCQPVEWLSGLMRWMAAGRATLAIPHLLKQALEQAPEVIDLASRASVFLELVITLVSAGRPVDALASLFSSAAEHLADQGAGRTLAQAWLLLPAGQRSDAFLGDLVAMLGRREDAGEAAWFLLRGLRAQGQEAQAMSVLDHWARHRGTRPPSGPDWVIDEVADGPDAEAWVRAVARTVPLGALRRLIAPAIGPRQGELWLTAELEYAQTHRLLPRDRFVALGALLPAATPELESSAIGHLEEVLATASFPDPEVANTAGLFAEAPEPSPLWMWVAVAASGPEQFTEETIDATVHAYCAAPPRVALERQLSVAVARRLGRADAWSAIDHARWLVRLILAPDGDQSGHNRGLGLAMLQSMLKRADGLDRVIAIAKAIFELPPDHEALRFFIGDVLSRLWRDGPPDAFMRALQVHKQPTEVRSAWRQAFGHL